MDKIGSDKFVKFIEDNRKPVCRKIVSVFKVSVDDAMDIYQDSIIALYNSIDSVLPTSLESYFKGIWYNQTLKFLRKNKRKISYDTSVSSFEANETSGISFRKVNRIVRTIHTSRISPELSASPDNAFDLNQMRERVSKALDEMAHQCRQLLTKHYIEGYSWKELAVQYELKNADSAKAVANKCRRRFEEKYKELRLYVK